MGIPRRTLSKWKYAAIEGILSSVPFAGGALTSVLKLVCRTEEEKRQEENPTIVTLTQAEYDALDPPDENTLYLIREKNDAKRKGPSDDGSE